MCLTVLELQNTLTVDNWTGMVLAGLTTINRKNKTKAEAVSFSVVSWHWPQEENDSVGRLFKYLKGPMLCYITDKDFCDDMTVSVGFIWLWPWSFLNLTRVCKGIITKRPTVFLSFSLKVVYSNNVTGHFTLNYLSMPCANQQGIKFLVCVRIHCQESWFWF